MGRKEMSKFKIGGIIVGLVLILGLIISPLFLEKINNGFVGVVYSPNGGVKKETLGPGVKVVGLFNKVTEYPTRLQTTHAKNLGLATSDGKNITIDFNYNYKADATKVVDIFNQFGPMDIEDLASSFLNSRLKNAARNEISQYSVLELYGSKSSLISAKIQEDFAKDVEQYGFEVTGLVLGTPHPDKATQAAIDATVKAKQELERKNTEVLIAKKNAEKQLIQAQGSANAKIAAAEGEAKSNKLLEQSITPQLIQLKEAEARLKHGWVTVQGASSIITK
jgi:regulator of protease activity HflC (stomatin/prohibitin superfamily)